MYLFQVDTNIHVRAILFDLSVLSYGQWGLRGNRLFTLKEGVHKKRILCLIYFLSFFDNLEYFVE